MCHPERDPRVVLPDGEGYEVFVNKTPNYAEAYRVAMAKAVSSGMDLVTADTDGYHPLAEILRLALEPVHGERPALVLPFRENLGIQSRAFSSFYSLAKRRRVRDATTGLCRLTYELLQSLPPLKAADMTIHIEILNFAIRTHADIIQYGYTSGANDRAGSKRTANYQWKLLKAMFR